MIYRANFRDPSIFFTAGQFPMRHRDVIYVTNADFIELEKFLSHVRFVTGSVAGVTGDVLSTRRSRSALWAADLTCPFRTRENWMRGRASKSRQTSVA